MAERAIKIQKLKIDSKADTIIAFYKYKIQLIFFISKNNFFNF